MAKIKELRAALETTSALKLAKIDKEILDAVISNHIAIHNAVKKAEDDFETARKGFMKGIEERFEEYNNLAQKINISEPAEQREILKTLNCDYPDVDEAAKKIREYREQMDQMDIAVEFVSINRAKYLESLKAANPDYTVRDIVNVEFLLSE